MTKYIKIIFAACIVLSAATTSCEKDDKEFTVTFNSNGGSEVPKQTVKDGEKATKPSPDPTKDGNTFDGWYKETALTNVWNFAADAVKANTTLYARWNAIPLDAPVITITAHPADVAVAKGEISVSLTVEATVTQGATLTYQWYSNTSASNEGGTGIGGSNSATWEISATLNVGTYYFFCEVSAEGAETVRTNAATVTVNAPSAITITAHPADAAVALGAISGSLTVEATVTQGATLAYQWYSNTAKSNTGGTKIEGATSASFTIPATLTEGAYYYFCEVSAAGAEPVRSLVATVTVSVVAVTGVTLNKTATTILIGGSETLIATVQPTGASNKAVTWESSNTARVTVAADGTVSIPAGATAGQTAVITVRTADGNFTATCTVAVGGVITSQFYEGGIYYKIISGTNVKVTNKIYSDAYVSGIEDSYTGAVTVLATVAHDGVTYSVTAVGSSAFYGNEGVTSVSLPASITAIEANAFAACAALKTVSLNEGLKTIGANAFAFCGALTALHIPSTVTDIAADNTVFYGCNNLTITAAAGGAYSAIDGALFESYAGNPLYYLRWFPLNKTVCILPEGTVYIRDFSIYDHGGVTAITFPASVTTIPAGINFRGSTSLATLTFKGATPPAVPTPANLLAYVGTVTLHVPAGAKAAYLAHDVWGAWGSSGIVED